MIFRVSAAVASLVLLAACTSTDGGDQPTATSSAPSPVPPATTSAPPSTSGPASTSPGASRAPLAVLDGAYLLAGADPDSARLYRVTGGRAVPATSVSGISSVSADGTTVVVGRDTGSAETVQRLRDGRLTGVGIGSGFAPALSDDGALAYAVLGGSSTPGISKPGGVSVRTRATPTGADRIVATLPAGSSVLGLTWSGDDLVVAVSDGEATRLVAYVDGRGKGRGLAPGIFAAAPDTAALVGGDDAVAVGSDDGATPARVVSLRSGEPRDVAAGWQPVCFADDDLLVVSKGATLATVAVGGSGEPGAPRAVGRAPAPVFGGSCD